VFFLGSNCCEEFYEILLLCGNGYGAGATRLLRTLYENAVTTAYIATHPEEADNFLDYNCVHEKRMLDNFKKVAPREVEKTVPADRIKQIADTYEAMKAKFQMTDCKKCGTKKLQQGWTKKSPEQLASIAGERYQSLYVYCYFLPMLRTHATAAGMADHMELKEGMLTVDTEGGKRMVNTALLGAHRVLLAILRTQDEYFKLGLAAEIEEREKDFLACWRGKGWR
jgi:hypothetical protein